LVEVQYRLLREGTGVLNRGLTEMLAAGIQIARDMDDALLAVALSSSLAMRRSRLATCSPSLSLLNVAPHC
jgi:hypothetical protein